MLNKLDNEFLTEVQSNCKYSIHGLKVVCNDSVDIFTTIQFIYKNNTYGWFVDELLSPKEIAYHINETLDLIND